MKINKTKVTITTLALAMGAALAGSISGSVAWYQYSTRASAKVAGVSAGTARNLQIAKAVTSGDPEWTNAISYEAVNFRPVSVVADGATISKFVEHPVYQYEELPELTENEKTTDGITTVAYADYEFIFRVKDTIGADEGDEMFVAKNVYLSYFNVAYTTASGTKDITSAVRVSIDGTNDFIVSKNGGDTLTEGNLDIGGATGNDTNYWDCKDEADPVTNGLASYVKYTNDKTVVAPAQSKYTSTSAANVKANVDDEYDLEPTTANSNKNAGKDIALTTTAGSSNTVKVRIWIEGWQELNSSSLWDAGYLEQNFEVQMQFQVAADK